MLTAEEFDSQFERHGSVTAVARANNVSRQTIYNWMNEIGYEPPKNRRRRSRKKSDRGETTSAKSDIRESLNNLGMDNVVIPNNIQSELIPIKKVTLVELKNWVIRNYGEDDPVAEMWIRSIDSGKRLRTVTDTIEYVNAFHEDYIRNFSE